MISFRTHIQTFLYMCICTCFMIVSVHADMKPGDIKVVKVQGYAFKTSKGATVDDRLIEGMLIKESDSISTRANSSAILLFSNGSIVSVQEKTNLNIETYKQDNYTGNVNIAHIDFEPSTSITQLSLDYGSIIGSVKPLSVNKGSSYTMRTPNGVAGIRGTKYHLINSPATIQDGGSRATKDISSLTYLGFLEGYGYFETNDGSRVAIGTHRCITADNNGTYFLGHVHSRTPTDATLDEMTRCAEAFMDEGSSFMDTQASSTDFFAGPRADAVIESRDFIPIGAAGAAGLSGVEGATGASGAANMSEFIIAPETQTSPGRTETGSGTNIGTGNNTGSGINIGTGTNTGSGTNIGTGTNTGSGTNIGTGTNTGSGTTIGGTGTGTIGTGNTTTGGSGSNTGGGTNTGTGNNTGSGTNTGTGNNTGNGTNTGTGNNTGDGTNIGTGNNGGTKTGGSGSGVLVNPQKPLTPQP